MIGRLIADLVVAGVLLVCSIAALVTDGPQEPYLAGAIMGLMVAVAVHGIAIMIDWGESQR